ncbi:restriction endonuclease PLD domain-containing protein [Desulfoscipio gibsoniae]|uniref:NgoFVII restriction endonuclease n=1 Tax=Desulfoscipio gibsoniae DSM 7213 TaxID=767817 RepID=R4KQI0_9FIRM|nr:restriction endonuclease PLD domain-containing protein [Desulfoscipio gibsoniae]AGL02840.1 NgoFVII restriction endonuclease [Desulfoscipio gibsoniae DSM 7213]
MFDPAMVNQILIEPITRGAQQLLLLSGYATPTMASWHMMKIKELEINPIDIKLIVGMTNYDGLTIDAHEGFRQLVNAQNGSGFSSFQCQYICQGAPVHSKLYIWLKDDKPFEAYTGSANYTQAGFSTSRREYIVPCNPEGAFDYYNQVECDSIYCTHSEVEDNIVFTPTHPVLESESEYTQALRGEGIEPIKLSLLARNGETGTRSGLNWGQRDGREPNQAYIGLPASIARSGFFPLEKQHFSVVTDDNKQLILRVEQQNDKAITTPMNNSLLGEYFRNRIGVANGAYIWRADLERYGRTDVDFYKLDDEHYYMDFSV